MFYLLFYMCGYDQKTIIYFRLFYGYFYFGRRDNCRADIQNTRTEKLTK